MTYVRRPFLASPPYGRLADTCSEGLNARARQVGLHLMELGRHALSLLAPRTRLVARMRLRREAWGVQRL
jgi:hypothetical protein